MELYGGGSYTLPLLLEWSVTLTGGVPCDSFQLRCLYDKGMAAALDKAWRVTLTQRDLSLRAVVDEYEIAQDSRGRTLFMTCPSGQNQNRPCRRRSADRSGSS